MAKLRAVLGDSERSTLAECLEHFLNLGQHEEPYLEAIKNASELVARMDLPFNVDINSFEAVDSFLNEADENDRHGFFDTLWDELRPFYIGFTNNDMTPISYDWTESWRDYHARLRDSISAGIREIDTNIESLVREQKQSQAASSQPAAAAGAVATIEPVASKARETAPTASPHSYSLDSALKNFKEKMSEVTELRNDFDNLKSKILKNYGYFDKYENKENEKIFFNQHYVHNFFGKKPKPGEVFVPRKDSVDERIAKLRFARQQIYSLAEAKDDEDADAVSDKMLRKISLMSFKDFVNRNKNKIVRATLEELAESEDFVVSEDRIQKVNKDKARQIRHDEIINAGFDLTPIVDGRTFVMGTEHGGEILYAQQLKRRCLEDYVAFAKSLIDQENRKEASKIVLITGALSKNAEFPIGRYVGAMYKEVREKFKEYFGDVGQDAVLRNLINGKESADKLREVIMQELGSLVVAKLQNGSASDKRKAAVMESFLRRFKTEEYDKRFGWTEFGNKSHAYNLFEPTVRGARDTLYSLFDFSLDFGDSVKAVASGLSGFVGGVAGLSSRSKMLKKVAESDCPWMGRDADVYEIMITKDPKLLKAAAEATQESCIRGGDLLYFREIVEDEGTISLVGKINGKLSGYSRIFMTKDELSGLPQLFIDTIEPPRKQFDDFSGLVSAFSLAAIQLGMEVGASKILGYDSRIKFGPRQAYASTSNKFMLRKVGKHAPIKMYTIGFNLNGRHHVEEPCNSYVLAENWRVVKND